MTRRLLIFLTFTIVVIIVGLMVIAGAVENYRRVANEQQWTAAKIRSTNSFIDTAIHETETANAMTATSTKAAQ